MAWSFIRKKCTLKCKLTNEKTKHLRSWTRYKNTVRPYGSFVFCTYPYDPILDVVRLTYLSPILHTNYCFPILSGFGHYLSSQFIMPLYKIILFISSITVWVTKTMHQSTNTIPCFLISWSDLYSELLWYLSFPVESNSKSRNSWP